MRMILFCLLAVWGGSLSAGAESPASSAWTVTERAVAQRNFFGLTAMADNAAVLRALQADSVLSSLTAARSLRLQQAVESCHDAHCFGDAVRWPDAEIDTVAAELARMARQDAAVYGFVETALRASGRFNLYRQQSPEELIVSAWKDAAKGMNLILAVYGEAQPPLYARIDSMRYDPKSTEWVQYLRGVTVALAQEDHTHPPFFFVSMKYAVMLLAGNDRLDAGLFEPLEVRENAVAVQRARAVAWNRYPYSAIVVPGEGPEQPDVALSPLGRIRVEQAVRLYREKKAPFLLVTGGRVHPMLTKFDEAMEMRRELIEQWGVPANAILVDPYARHTTTNLRNASREAIRYKLPLSKPMLIASDPAQIGLIASAAFAARCLREMHLLPWTQLRRIQPTEVEMLPSADALQEDPTDPMDP